MSLVWMPVEAGEKTLKESTRYGVLRQFIDLFARLFFWKTDRTK